MTTNPPAIVSVQLHDGRTAYRVADVIVMDPQDALDLLTPEPPAPRCAIVRPTVTEGPVSIYTTRIVWNPVLQERRCVVGLLDRAGNWVELPYETLQPCPDEQRTGDT